MPEADKMEDTRSERKLGKLKSTALQIPSPPLAAGGIDWAQAEELMLIMLVREVQIKSSNFSKSPATLQDGEVRSK